MPTTATGTDLDIERALSWALNLAVRHLLSHPTDETNLSLAIELLKAIKYEPDAIPRLFERWELDPDAARAEQARLNALPLPWETE